LTRRAYGLRMRLFIAVELGEEVRNRIAVELDSLQRMAPDAKWVRVESIHVTLAFLGHQPEDGVPAIRAAIEKVAATGHPVSLQARGLGSFGSSRRPRVLWVGLHGEVELLAQLQHRLEAELIPLGYQPEQRAFNPHLTLARARNPSGDAKLLRCVEHGWDIDFGRALVDRLVLFRSDLSREGARYTALHESRFRNPDQ
jgi:RNA 2',3'-cyclic 3'-phosphodiesterase